MKLNHHAGEITGYPNEFGEWYYWISLFGQPAVRYIRVRRTSQRALGLADRWSPSDRQLLHSGRPNGDDARVSRLGADFRGMGKICRYPAFPRRGNPRVAADERLNPEQKKQAVIGDVLPRDVITSAQVDNIELAYAGIRYGALTAPQKQLLRQLIDTYVGRIRPGHDAIRRAEVERHLSQTYFGWIGACDETSPFYYRIFSPVILIEFDHLPGDHLGQSGADAPSRSHRGAHAERQRLRPRPAAPALPAARSRPSAHPAPARRDLVQSNWIMVLRRCRGSKCGGILMEQDNLPPGAFADQGERPQKAG